MSTQSNLRHLLQSVLVTSMSGIRDRVEEEVDQVLTDAKARVEAAAHRQLGPAASLVLPRISALLEDLRPELEEVADGLLDAALGADSDDHLGDRPGAG